MLKSLLNSLLVFWFTVSITGVPVMMHYCEMQNTASLQKCAMCSQEENEDAEEYSCCSTEDEEDQTAAPEKLNSLSSCCYERLAAAPLSIDSECFKVNNVHVNAPTVDMHHVAEVKDFSAFYNMLKPIIKDNSPPGVLSVPLNILNSTFLV